VKLIRAGTGHVASLADLHATSFAEPWSAADIADLLDGPGGFGLIAEDDAAEPRAFILARAIAGEAEILTLAVAPPRRRLGLARALIDTAGLLAAGLGAQSMFLEVASDNLAAIGLYRAAGFTEVGRRRGYYQQRQGPPTDALVMRRDLNTAPG
jgi:[ribosomal protein S18]-alanine N-acetyltransferase